MQQSIIIFCFHSFLGMPFIIITCAYPQALMNNDLYLKTFYYFDGNETACRIQSGSLYEAHRCLCSTKQKNTVVNERLMAKIKNLFSAWLEVKAKRSERQEEEKTSVVQTLEPLCKILQYFHGDVFITYESNRNRFNTENTCNSRHEYIYLPESFNKTFLRKQLLYMRTVDTCVFLVLCSLECTVMILETAVQVGMGGFKHIWVIPYLDVTLPGTALPNNLFIVTDDERTVKGNGTETRCKYNLESQMKQSPSVGIQNAITEETGPKIYAKVHGHHLDLVGGFNSLKIKFNSNAKTVLQTLHCQYRKTVRNIRAVTIIHAPFVMIHDDSRNIINLKDMTCTIGNVCWRYQVYNETKKRVPYCCIGFSMDLFNLIAANLKLTADIYIVEDKAFGQVVNGSWVGLIGDLIADKADIAIACISINSKRARYVDFTTPYMAGGITVVVKAAHKEKSFVNFEAFEPLTAMLWLTVILTTFLSSFVLVVFESRCLFRKVDSYPWIESIVYLAGLLFQKDIAGKNPNKPAARAVSVMLALVLLVIMSSYTAVLTAIKVTYESQMPISGLTDPKMTNPTHNFKFGTLANSVFTQIFAESEDPTWNRMGIFMKSYNFLNSKIGFEKLASGELDALISDHQTSLYYMAKDCRLQIVGDVIPEAGYGFALQKGGLLTHEISNLFRLYSENDVIRNLEKKWIIGSCKDVSDGYSSGEVAKIGITYFGGLFIVAFFWIGLSMFILLMELFTRKYILRN
ncbi:glutamate receptor ionotropic, NMDA 3A-like [Hydractinia symbiolongicarpus]|uniref:glutamate receptor ionotropic, NMDA 3A-like n=1 Tax=Hydractinia symbiolongicarpus TaxID=13093 RepID=UPI002551BF48|nr:glutamate receptor ionotropic, NMDA 3A-like [Hydractinia symbiolongicarpus]